MLVDAKHELVRQQPHGLRFDRIMAIIFRAGAWVSVFAGCCGHYTSTYPVVSAKPDISQQRAEGQFCSQFAANLRKRAFSLSFSTWRRSSGG
jgi:hypothetical protein